jgi:hypothetical protein
LLLAEDMFVSEKEGFQMCEKWKLGVQYQQAVAW